MDEDLLKRNTDCVYFLASPFTCKKGADCEYRHSEMARLNPTDCWYWLSGSCLNPTCGYRHPPVDMGEAPDEVEPLPNPSSLPPSKNNVPCYFYLNGYCNRGDKCLFLHGPKDISTSIQRNLDDRIASDSKNHVMRPAKVLNGETHTKIPIGKPCCRTEPVVDDPFPWQRLRDMSTKLAPKQSPQRYAYIANSDLYHSDKTEGSPSICSDEKFESGVQDEWWESSPEFDVLVKETSAQFEGQDYIVDYDDCYEINNVEHGNSYIQRCYEEDQLLRMHGPLYNSTLGDIDYSDGDLRVHLRKQRFLGALRQRVHGRLEEKLERKSYSVPIQRSVFFAGKQRREPWKSQFSKQRRGYRHKNGERRVNSEASFTRSSKAGRSYSEKCRVKADSSNSVNFDFEGPKPLCEILKGKKVASGSNHGT